MGSIPVKGTLLISGAGRVTELRPRFLEAMGGKEARLLIIPSTNDIEPDGDQSKYGWKFVPEFKTAGAFEVDIDEPDFKDKWNWAVHWCQEAELRNAAVLYTSDRDTADSDAFAEQIDAADGIMFTGGTPKKMVPTYLDTKAHAAFHRLVDRGGAVMGWSAGASIQGGVSATTEVDAFQRMFGFLPDTAIQTHFLIWNHQFMVPPFIEAHPEILGIGLDERAAIVVHENEFEVIGTSYVAIYDYNKVLLPDGKFYLIGPGDRFSLTERRVIGKGKTYLKQVVDKTWAEI